MTLITKNHTDLLGCESRAIYSPCEKYRYYLERVWDHEAVTSTGRNPLIMIMLNPSTATEFQNDPTVERCERRARQNGFSGMVILNIFAYRATDPQDMRAQADPVGPENDHYIAKTVRDAPSPDNIVCGWGTHGTLHNREARVFEILKENSITPQAFKWTKAGHPQHPLYVAYSEQPKLRAA